MLYFRNILSFLITAFALLTLFLSGSIIFDFFGIREKEGNYVLFVVVANFFCSILYLLSAYFLFRSKKGALFCLGAAFIVLLGTFFAFQSHIRAGGEYETKTGLALIFRISLTAVFLILAYFVNKKKKKHE